MEEYLALHHPELVFHIFARPDVADIQGDYYGHGALRELHDRLRTIVGGTNFSLEVHDTLASSAHGVWLIQFFPDRNKSPDDHETIYVVCEFHDGLISQAWFVFWPRKEVVSNLHSEGHAADGRMLERVIRETPNG
jgi:hypothetical protein